MRGIGYNMLPMLVHAGGRLRVPAGLAGHRVPDSQPTTGSRWFTSSILISWALTATTHLICYFFVSRKVDRELRAHEAELAAHEAELAARMEESPEEADS